MAHALLGVHLQDDDDNNNNNNNITKTTTILHFLGRFGKLCSTSLKEIWGHFVGHLSKKFGALCRTSLKEIWGTLWVELWVEDEPNSVLLGWCWVGLVMVTTCHCCCRFGARGRWSFGALCRTSLWLGRKQILFMQSIKYKKTDVPPYVCVPLESLICWSRGHHRTWHVGYIHNAHVYTNRPLPVAILN